MSPDLTLLFSFMACTFGLGLFIGWALWRYGAAEAGPDPQVELWKKSFEQSRLAHWDLEQKYNELLEKHDPGASRRTSQPSTRRRRMSKASSQHPAVGPDTAR